VRSARHPHDETSGHVRIRLLHASRHGEGGFWSGAEGLLARGTFQGMGPNPTSPPSSRAISASVTASWRPFAASPSRREGRDRGIPGPERRREGRHGRMLSCFLPPAPARPRSTTSTSRDAPPRRERMIASAPEDNLDPDFHVVQNSHVYGGIRNSRKVIRDRALELLAFVALSDKPTLRSPPLGRHERRLVLARALLTSRGF